MPPNHLIRVPALAAAFSSSSSASSSRRLLKIGDVLNLSRRFTDADVVGYSAVTGDRNPVHLDADFSRQIAGFDGGRVVHGLLVASLFPSLIASAFPGAVYASQNLQFKLPVYIEDEVLAEVQATSIRAIKEKYYVKWSTKCYTSKESLVIDGEATTILPQITMSELVERVPFVPNQCGPACACRCSEAAHRKPCLFFCNKFCATCLCVPSGTWGHREECPCYITNWKTTEGKTPNVL